MEAKNSPSFQSEANKRAVTNTTFMRDLVEGTKHVQSKGETYLHKFNMEDDRDYKDRLKNSEVIPSTAEAIKSITGKLLLQDTKGEDTHDNFNFSNIDISSKIFV